MNEGTDRRLWLIGEGRLADELAETLRGRCGIVRLPKLPKHAGDGEDEDVPTLAIPSELQGVEGSRILAVSVQDDWRPSAYRTLHHALSGARIAWLNGFLQDGEAVIGNLTRPGLAGCPQCADNRRLVAGRDELFARRWSGSGGRNDSLRVQLEGAGIRLAARLLADEACRYWQGDAPLTEEHLLILDLRQRTLSRHRFLPDPACEICGSLPEDSPALGAIRLQSRPKSGPLAYRARPLTELARVLEEAYADSRAGLMNRVFVPSATPFADVCVNLPLFGADEVAAGRSHAYWTSKQTAILEGLERYCGLMARDRRIVVSGAYRQLSGQAADPGSFGLYPPERYEEEDCEFQPFDPEAAIEWVWGYSLTEGRPKLVPLAFAYYHVSGMGGFAYETSNGCAVGGSLEEAILHGIWEAVERDAFLLAWHARLPAPRIDPDAFGDEECSLMIERLRSVYGFEVRMFDITTDIGIPCLWVMAKNLADGGISQISAAGGHPDPVHAAKSAMFELAGLLPSIDLAFGEHRARCEEMLDNDELVEEMSDHALLYCLPEAAKRLDFLGGTEPAGGSGGEVRTWRMATGNLCRNGDLREDLEELTDVFRKLGLEILVVNQTAPELARHGLACVKVLVPGLLPMTFGHRNSRIAGLERARRLPRDLGYAAEPLGPERLNLRPHPFP